MSRKDLIWLVIWTVGLSMSFPLAWIDVHCETRRMKKDYRKRTGRDYDEDMMRLTGKDAGGR